MNKYPEFSADNPFGTQAKMLFHLDRVHQYMKHDTFPVFVEINLTDKCNLNCEWCISSNRGKDTLRSNELLEFLREFKCMGGKAVTLSGGGEPTMHPDFTRIAIEASEMGLELGLMTNGVFHEKYCPTIGKVFKWVRVSLDTVDQKKYKKWKGTDAVLQVLKNIKILHEYPVKLGVNCNVGMEYVIEDARSLMLSVIDICDYIQYRPILPRFFNKDEKVELNSDVWDFLTTYKDHPKINLSYDKFKDFKEDNLFPFRSCEGHFFSPVLNSDGDLKVCMYHLQDKQFSFGNIYTNPLFKIWTSKKRQEVIHFVRKLNYSEKCQVCCKLCELNKFIDFISYPDKNMDINFL